jgi:integrase
MPTIILSAVARLRKPGRYRLKGDIPRGLYLRITDTGARYFLLRYVADGRERWMGLGSVADIGTEGAAATARAARQSLRDGRDPIDERRATRVRIRAEASSTRTFSQAATAYHQHHSLKFKNARDASQLINRLEKFAFPQLGALNVNAIDSALILRAFAPHWTVGSVHAAARTLRAVAEVFDFAKARGWRQGDNPAEWKNFVHDLHPPAKIAPTRTMAALPYGAVPEFYAGLGESTVEQATRFTILTAARSGEALGARWAEIDFDKATWTLSKERMKMDREHVVPLSTEAIKLLKALPHEKGNGHLFVGARPGAPLQKLAMITLIQRRKLGFTVHGFRSSFRTWAAERTSFPPDVIEMSLAHLVGGETERAYNRSQLVERRRPLMEAWAAFVVGKEAKSAQVIPLHEGKGL